MKQANSESGASGVHQVDTDSSLAQVLGLRPLNKSLRVHQSQQAPAWGLWTFVVGWESQGVVSRVVKLKLIKIWLCEERALHRNIGADQGTGGEMALTPKLHTHSLPVHLLHPWILSRPH